MASVTMDFSAAERPVSCSNCCRLATVASYASCHLSAASLSSLSAFLKPAGRIPCERRALIQFFQAPCFRLVEIGVHRHFRQSVPPDESENTRQYDEHAKSESHFCREFEIPEHLHPFQARWDVSLEWDVCVSCPGL